MTPKLSITVNLFCSFLWIFQPTEGQFIQNIKQPLKRIVDVNESFSNLSLTNVEVLDVQKLNKLLSLIDKTWILPCPGTHQPIGSNFKYKRTCENIYQTNDNDICQQISFGIMCFNYCYEQGEILKFQCKDIADPAYCKNNSAYDRFLMKYQNNPKKAKSYIRQMISRCYATAICDSEHGILNTSIIDESNKDWKSDNEVSNLSLTTEITNQQKIPQIIQQQQKQLLQTKQIQPIPIQQLLLLRHKMIAAAKSSSIMNEKEENRLDEVLSKENSKNVGKIEIIEENSSKEINVERSLKYKQEKTTKETTTISTMQTISKNDVNQERLMEQIWWWCKALQQMNNSTDYLAQ